ncbi:MAG TPA: HEAT repeat domain-containing protein [Steroidobacteraceae bacterium]|nr:HEAT repeat domain-containing protein [Steroidobacteraceae bacterium]
MSFFSTLKTERLIAEIREAADPQSPVAQKAVQKLASMGAAAIAPIVEALGQADKRETVAYVEALSAVVDNKTFPLLIKGMAENNARAVAGIAWALSTSKNYAPGLLLEALTNPDASKPAILEVIAAQRSRFGARELLTAAYNQEPNEKAALFRIVGDMVDANSVPDLISRVEGKDVLARVHIINMLSRFNLPQVSEAIQKQLKDSNKLVRQAALTALTRTDQPIAIEPVAKLLLDGDIDIQNKAVDVLIKQRHPDTVKHLLPALKDESEYARRAAVEVLNEVGDARSIKNLLDAIKDDDWWVRSRAADALGKIGGPKVVDAVLQLIKDDDEDIRRSAIEILNQTKDERAISHLIEATKDKDWWVSERAVDALAEIGSKRAIPRLVEMLGSQTQGRSLPTVVRALGKLGDTKIIEPLFSVLQRPEKEVKLEAIQALAKLADERRADVVRNQIQAASIASGDQTIANAALRAVEEIDKRHSTGSSTHTPGVAASTSVGATARASPDPRRTAATPAPPPAAPAPTATQAAKTLLMDNAEVAAIVKQHEAAAKLDIATLKPGDILEGRYKFIEKIGRGAFGTVLLMEDTVVDERLILKFLNPNVAQDEEIMQRFVHELRYSRKITHKNVIRIYDFLYIKGNYAISMEYFPSHTLGTEINEKPMDVKKALQFGIDMANGMTVAHHVGIVHRDLKPANILINNEGLLKIVDFGVAAAQREGDTQLTKTGYVIGSPKYMAPEQILGKKVDETADIYSIGVIMYEMFTGQPPYSRGDHMSVMYQHVQGKARPPKEMLATVPQGVSDLVMKAMSVDKTKRFPNMEALREALEKQL